MRDPIVYFCTDLHELQPEIEYICCLFNSILRFRLKPIFNSDVKFTDKPLIQYSSKSSLLNSDISKIVIEIDEQFWSDYQKKKVPDVWWQNLIDIPVLTSKSGSEFTTRGTSSTNSGLDIFASTFFLITRLEEVWSSGPRDCHGRCLFEQSQHTPKTILRPLINEYAGLLQNWLNECYGMDIRTRQNRLTALISHDIDLPYFYGNIRSEASELYRFFKKKGKYHNVADVLGFFKHALKLRPDPYETFDYIRTQESKRGIQSTWFILMSPDNQWGLPKRKYARRLRWIVSQGCEIGIHPGYDSAFDVERIRREQDDVEQMSGIRIQGVRNHFLRFEVPKSYRNYETMSLLYDSTLGYAEQEGYRAGIATPFKPFDIDKRRTIDLIEIPLIIMDGVLKNYRGMPPGEALARIRELIKATSNCNATITFNWHNTFLANQQNPWRSVFEESLDYLIENRAKMSDSRSIAHRLKLFWDQAS